jgi:hypothetical protein
MMRFFNTQRSIQIAGRSTLDPVGRVKMRGMEHEGIALEHEIGETE